MIYDNGQFLNNRQTFSTFAVGPANGKAVKVVQEWMAGNKKHRIVFLYGNTGCGKTHLAKAFYKQMQKQGVKVRMRDVDSFTAELVGWLRFGGTLEGYYENYDKLAEVLIIDDIRSFENTPVAAGYCKEVIKRFVKAKKKVLVITDSKAAIYRWPGWLLSQKIRVKKPDKQLKKDILKKYAAARSFFVSEEILECVSEIDADMTELTAVLHEGLTYNKILGEKLNRELIEKIWDKRMSQKRRTKR